MFYNIRTDLDKFKYAVHITKIIQDVTNENENSYKILQLFLNTLYMLSETDKDADFIISVFKMKLLCLLGFKPRIDDCTVCGSKENLNYFSIKDNGLKCNECHGPDKGTIHISDSTVTALKYIILAPPLFPRPSNAHRNFLIPPVPSKVSPQSGFLQRYISNSRKSSSFKPNSFQVRSNSFVMMNSLVMVTIYTLLNRVSRKLWNFLRLIVYRLSDVLLDFAIHISIIIV